MNVNLVVRCENVSMEFRQGVLKEVNVDPTPNATERARHWLGKLMDQHGLSCKGCGKLMSVEQFSENIFCAECRRES